MKTILLSAAAVIGLTVAASAADLPLRTAAPSPTPAPFYQPVPVFTWSGFYVGAQAGYAWGEDETRLIVGGVTLALPQLGTFETDGFVGGAHAGFNVQVGALVFGAEADIEAADLQGSRTLTDPGLPGYSASASADINFQGSFRGRLGLALDRTLIYATGGVAFANIENTYSVTLPVGNPLGIPGGTYSESRDDTQWGWTVGGGVEFAFTNNLTLRAEYRFTQFDSYRVTSTFLSPGDAAEQEPDFHTGRVGVSFKF